MLAATLGHAPGAEAGARTARARAVFVILIVELWRLGSRLAGRGRSGTRKSGSRRPGAERRARARARAHTHMNTYNYNRTKPLTLTSLYSDLFILIYSAFHHFPISIRESVVVVVVEP